MNLKKLSTVCVALVNFLFISNVFADTDASFVRKVIDGGSISQLIQTTNGNYVYLGGSNITTVRSISGKSISQLALSIDVPEEAYPPQLTGFAQSQNGLILVGYARLGGYYGDDGALIIKIGSEGGIEWAKGFEPNTNDLDARSAIPASDGGFILTGGLTPDGHPVLIKFSSAGDVLWSKSFDTLSWSFDSAPTLDGGIILSADIFQSDGGRIGVNVIKIDGTGNIVWSVTLKIKDFSVQSIISLTNKGYLLAGRDDNSLTLLLVSLNEDGTLHSKSAYALNVPFWISSLANTLDGGVAIGGTLRNKSGSVADGFIIKIDDRQRLIFQKRLGFPESEEAISSVIVKEDGSFLLFGSTASDTLFAGLNREGLVPGCSFSQNLNVTKVLFGSLKRQKLDITPNDFLLEPRGPINAKLKRLNRPISSVCVN